VLNFVSGNAKKFEEVCAIIKPELPDIEIKQVSIDLPELQGEPEEIVAAKLKIALDKAKGPLIVEDTSLCFNAIKELPGPYIKTFLSKLGTSGLYKMVHAYEDHSGYAQCIFGMAKGKKDLPKIFIGRTHGDIVPPRGPENFGWDPVFQPKDNDKTYAEMDKDEKNSLSHRYKALKQLIEWLKENPDYI
jgi:inosine triphosphate pyrophosphatase